MKFGDVIGHQGPVSLLRGALAAGRLPHALLFQGPEGVGKGTVARALAAALLCEAAGDEACGRCAACVKLRRRAHPDLLVVRRVDRKLKETDTAPMDDAPADDEDDEKLSQLIRVFQIRQLSRHASFSPREGAHRVFLIEPADRMNEEAQNALLKTLEEPPGATRLMLVASRPHLLLPTVRSRCLAIRFAPIPAAELARALERRGMDPREAADRATLAAGRPGKAMTLDPQALGERRARLVDALEALAGSPRALARVPAMAADLAGKTRGDLLEGLALLEGVLREALRLGAGLSGDTALDEALRRRLSSVGARLGPRRCADLVAGLQRLRGELRFNLNRPLLAESLLAAVGGGPLP